MKRTAMWVAAAIVLIATPAVIGLVVVSGDDGSRRAGALVAAGKNVGYQLVIPNVTPSGKAIAVESFSWGVSNAGAAERDALSAGRAQLSDLIISKKLDQTSPVLAGAVVTGKHFPTAVLTLLKQDAKGVAVKYATYSLTDVLIGSVQHSGAGDDIPSEQVSLNYGKLETQISTLDAAGLSPPENATFDLAALAQ